MIRALTLQVVVGANTGALCAAARAASLRHAVPTGVRLLLAAAVRSPTCGEGHWRRTSAAIQGGRAHCTRTKEEVRLRSRLGESSTCALFHA